MNYIHTIPARLYNNALTTSSGDLFARPENNDNTLSIADVCESAVQRGGADISAKAMQHAVELFMEEVQYRLCDGGFSVNMLAFIASMHIKGTFSSPHQPFDRSLHKVLAECTASPAFRDYITNNVDVVINGMADDTSYISGVKDPTTGSEDELISAGRPFFIYGKKIKIAGTDPNCGVYLNYTAPDGSQYSWKAQPTDLIINQPSELQIMTPTSLVAAQLTVVIKTQFAGSSVPLKQPRTITYNKVLHTP